MAEFDRTDSEVDDLLLRQVLAGDEDGWRTIVSRFETRLVAFASNQIGQVDASSVADDLAQETFVSFLKSVGQFRADCSLETFLFQIMRRRINDYFRKMGSVRAVKPCAISDVALPSLTGDLSASHYVQQEEQLAHDARVLGVAIAGLTTGLKEKKGLRDLQIAEGLFFAGLKNQQIAKLMEISQNEVAVTKHRLIDRLQKLLAGGFQEPDALGKSEDSLLPSLRKVWFEQRPSCPKRTTLGKYTLEILPLDWSDYVRFHVEDLGCAFCLANLSELNAETTLSRQQSEVLFQSTIGFLPGRN